MRNFEKLCNLDTYAYSSEIRGSVVRTVTDYGLDDQRVGVGVPVGQEFLSLHIVQTSSGVHPTSYPMGTRESFPESKAAVA
jgi:hypothetical protein